MEQKTRGCMLTLKRICRAVPAMTTGLLLCLGAQAQLTANNGHSHNDYNQDKPLYRAYEAGMGSIEADVFLADGRLHVAHDRENITPDRTLTGIYLAPLADLFEQNGGQPYPDASMELQLVIDIKDGHRQTIPALVKELEPFLAAFNPARNEKAIRIVISGDMPEPGRFSDYPAYLFFDGRPYIEYTPGQLRRIAMISDALPGYTAWRGEGMLSRDDREKITAVLRKARQAGKPFRFWAAPDTPEAWTILEDLGVSWINTDHPGRLREFYSEKAK